MAYGSEFKRDEDIIYDISTKQSIRQPCFKIEWIDSKGLVREEISKDIVSWSSTAKMSNGARRNLNITLTNKDLEYVPNPNNKIWLNTFLKLYTGFKDNITGEEYYVSQGMFCFKNPSTSSGNANQSISINCIDLYGRIDGSNGTGKLEADMVFNAGTPVKTMLEQLFIRCKEKKILPQNTKILIHPSLNNIDFPHELEFRTNDSYGNVMKKIADTFNYQIYFNKSGYLSIEPPVNQLKRGHIHRFFVGDMNYKSGVIQTQFDKFYNKVVVEGSQPNGIPIYATAEDNNPLSTTSIAKIGERLATPIRDDDIYTNNMAQNRANYELTKYLQSTWQGTITVLPIPILDVGDIIITNDEAVGFNNERGIINSITDTLGGNMTIKFSKVMKTDVIELT